MDESHPLIVRHRSTPTLNRGDLNDIRYVIISHLYLKDLKDTFDLRYSAQRTLVDTFDFMERPADYDVLFKRGLRRNLPVWAYDVFDLPDPRLETVATWPL